MSCDLSHALNQRRPRLPSLQHRSLTSKTPGKCLVVSGRLVADIHLLLATPSPFIAAATRGGYRDLSASGYLVFDTGPWTYSGRPPSLARI